MLKLMDTGNPTHICQMIKSIKQNALKMISVLSYNVQTRELDGSNIATALRSPYIPKYNATAVPFGPKQQVRIYVYIYNLNVTL